jgi:hypothetical protein
VCVYVYVVKLISTLIPLLTRHDYGSHHVTAPPGLLIPIRRGGLLLIHKNEQGLSLRSFVAPIFSRQIDYLRWTLSFWERNGYLQLSLRHQHKSQLFKQVLTSNSFSLAASNALRLGLISSQVGFSFLTSSSILFLFFAVLGSTTGTCSSGASMIPMSRRTDLEKYCEISRIPFARLTLRVIQWKGLTRSIG